MSLQPVVSGVYRISLGMVNAYLIAGGDGLTLIDTGYPRSGPAILKAVRELGKQPHDVRRILLTHLHTDHVGSAEAVTAATGARVYMHPLDAEEFLKGNAMRPVQMAPGLFNQVFVGGFIRLRKASPVQPAAVDEALDDGQALPFAGGLKVVHTPGHTAGHVALLWPEQGGVLFGGDACVSLFGLGLAPIYEDFQAGLRSLKAISSLAFETACLAHGAPICGGASAKFQQKWG